MGTMSELLQRLICLPACTCSTPTGLVLLTSRHAVASGAAKSPQRPGQHPGREGARTAV